MVRLVACSPSAAVTVVVDERLDDGGDAAAQGWVFHPPGVGEIGGSDLAAAFDVMISSPHTPVTT